MASSNNKTSPVIVSFLKDNFFSLIALIVSLISAFLSIKSYQDTVTQQAIDNTYKTFYDISVTGMSNPDVIHLCTMPESYDMVQKEIHLSLKPINEQKQAEYILKERAFANYLFGFYENTLIQYNKSVKNRNTERTQFLKEILDYLRSRILHNPRLVYLWDRQGGRMSVNYAESTREDYYKYVLNKSGSSLTISTDSVGPYYIDTLKLSR